ncbi:MAG: DUF3460 family protein [Polynucleobacter sp.]|jgi:hypothetical protein|nr:DUF3460 family protein [Polynucleobacter sp.]
MKKYKSDATRFLEQLKVQKPQLAQEQLQGRSLLWDQQPQSQEERRQIERARIKQKAYVYGNE